MRSRVEYGVAAVAVGAGGADSVCAVGADMVCWCGAGVEWRIGLETGGFRLTPETEERSGEGVWSKPSAPVVGAGVKGVVGEGVFWPVEAILCGLRIPIGDCCESVRGLRSKGVRFDCDGASGCG